MGGNRPGVSRAAEAAAAPRVHHQWTPDELRVEKGLSPDTLETYLVENIRISKARDFLAEQHAAAAAETPEVKSLIRELSVEAWLARKLAE